VGSDIAASATADEDQGEAAPAYAEERDQRNYVDVQPDGPFGESPEGCGAWEVGDCLRILVGVDLSETENVPGESKEEGEYVQLADHLHVEGCHVFLLVYHHARQYEL